MRAGIFLDADTVSNSVEPHGLHRWFSNPDVTQSKDLTLVEVTLEPGKSHDFHMHPEQDEIIYVVKGEIEQWLDTTSRTLKAGEAAFISKSAFHASINRGADQAVFLAIFGPSIGPEGATTIAASDHPDGHRFSGLLK